MTWQNYRDRFSTPVAFSGKAQCGQPQVRRRRGQGGFTLLELLVASAIFVVIGVMSYSGWYDIQNVKAGTETRAQRLDELQRAWHWIAGDFEQALDRPVRDQLGTNHLAFEANDVGDLLVEFTRAGWTNPAAGIVPNRSTLQRVGYAVEEQKLYRYHWYHLDRFDTESRKRRLLVSEVDAFSMRFLDMENKWHDDWPAQSLEPTPLPRAVELTVELADLGEIVRLFAIP